MASGLSAAAVVKHGVSSRSAKVYAVSRPSDGPETNSPEDPIRSLEGSLASLASLLASLSLGAVPDTAKPTSNSSFGYPDTLTPPTSRDSTQLTAQQQQSIKAALADLAQRLAACIAAARISDQVPLSQTSPPAQDLFRKALEGWADDYLPEPATAAADGGATGSAAAAAAAAAGPGVAARSMFKQLVASLLREGSSSTLSSPGAAAGSKSASRVAGGAGVAAGNTGFPLGRALLAAAAAAAAASGAGALGTAAGDGGSHPLKVTAKAVGSGTTDCFCPDGWGPSSSAAAAAAVACTPRTPPPVIEMSTADAAAAVAQDDTFDPSAWDVAAAAAAYAAASEGEASAGSGSSSDNRQTAQTKHYGTPATCWAVQVLARALEAAAASEHSSVAAGSTQGTHSQAISVQQLLLLSSGKAAGRLQQLSPAERAGLLLLLCGGSCGSRGDAWLGDVLGDVLHRLGLLEMGVVLAAVYNRHGKASFLNIAQQLPLNEPSDPYLTASLGGMQPAGVLQALLLHWLLRPQLAHAGLPTLPEPFLAQLLPQVMAALSTRQLHLASRWFEVWRVTQLQEQPAAHARATAETSAAAAAAAAGSLDVQAPTLEASVTSSAWCGLAGISTRHLAQVFGCAADALLPGEPSATGKFEEQHLHQHQYQLSQGSTAAAAQLRAVARALLMGLEPLQPMMLMVMQQLLLLPPAIAMSGSSSTSSAPAERQLQLLQLLLEAGSSSPLRVMSLAELVDASFSSVFKPSSSSSSPSTEWSDAAGTQEHPILMCAALDLLAALPAEQLQHELQQLLELQAIRYSSTTSSSKQPYSPAVYRLLISLAEHANPAQAAALLAVLPMPAWAAAWATFVSPAAGAFCCSKQQLAAAFAGVVSAEVQLRSEGRLWGTHQATGSAAKRTGSSSSWQKLEAAWAVLCAHFALGDVRKELQDRPEGQHASSSSSSSSNNYVPSVPFVGDGWDQDISMPAEAHAAPALYSGSLGAFAADVLQLLAPPAAACHVAALAQVLPVDGFARLAAQLLPPSAVSSVSAAGLGAAASSGVAALQKSLLRLYSSIPELPDAPVAVQLLASAAPQLPIDRLPAFFAAVWEVCTGLQRMPWLPGAAAGPEAAIGVGWQAAGKVRDARYGTGYAWNNAWPVHGNSSSEEGSSPLGAQEHFELVLAAASASRDSATLQQMLAVLVRQLSVAQAQLVVDVLGNGVSDAALAAASAVLRQRTQLTWNAPASETTKSTLKSSVAKFTGFEAEVVWQLGQSDAAVADAAGAAAARGGVGAEEYEAAAFAADRLLVREVVELVEGIPAAVPAGSFSMDAMQDPARISSVLKRLLSRLITWTPSCPSAAAAVAQQLTLLATRRAWSPAEAGAILQRLPLPTALQLLLESDSRSGGGGSSSSWMGRHRGEILMALVDWHGLEDTVGALRTLFAQYRHASIADFAGLMADLQPALLPGHCFLSSSSSSSSVWGLMRFDTPHQIPAILPGDAPNPYIAALLHVLGLMRGLVPAAETPQASSSGSSGGSSTWAGQLARVLCLLALLMPHQSSQNLAEAVGRSLAVFGESFLVKAAEEAAQPGAAAGWQASTAELLAALPAAAAATAGKGFELWGQVALAVSAGVATAAGGAALLPALQLAASSSKGSSTAGGKLAAWLPGLLQQLQAQGLLTCSVHFSSNNSGSYTSSSAAVPASACMNLQLVLLLQQLYQTDKVLSLQQALEALVALAPTLGKALPQAVAHVFGHPKARGYGASAGPDTAEAMAAMEAAVAAVPTGAAVPAAVATAGKQLSEVLAYVHELLPESAMIKLMAALAAALPWDSDTSSSSSSSHSNNGQGRDGCRPCPGDAWSEQQGWQGVTQKQLIVSSLLTASCAMWGFDKGTMVAQGLIAKLMAAAGPAKAAEVPEDDSRVLQHSSNVGQAGSHQTMAKEVLLRAASTGQLGCCTVRAAAGEAGPPDTSGRSSGSHASRAEAALMQAASSSTSAPGNSHAAAAGTALCSAAASGTAADTASQAGRAKACPLQAAATDTPSSSSSPPHKACLSKDEYSHAQRAQHALLWAAASSRSSGGHAELAQAKLLDAAAAGPVAAAGGSAFLWAVQQLREVAKQCEQHGEASSARTAISRMLSNAANMLPVESDSEAVGALLGALPQVILLHELAAQVLVQTQGLVPIAVWAQGLHTAAAAAAGQSGSGPLLQLLLGIVREVQLQLRVNVRGPEVYTEVLMAAADCIRPDSQATGAVHQLLQLMLTGQESTPDGSATFRGVPLAASAAAQLVIGLSRRRSPNSSNSSSHDDERDTAARQLQVVGAVVPAVLRHFSSGSSSSASVLVSCLAGQLYQAALLPRLYLTVLLKPHLPASQFATLIRQSGLTSGDTQQAAAALALLCNTLSPGKALPLATYVDMLAAALDMVSSESSSAAHPEARVGLELQKQLRQQQLLAAVVAVLGTFRGMRTMHSSPLGAHLLLPLSDLAAVLCYTRKLLPADTAAALAAAVARAMGQASGTQQLVQLFAQLPNAAAEGFGPHKGPAELWLPLLQQMAAAGGLPASEEADLIARLTAVAAEAPALPVCIAPSAGDDGELRFADPAAAAAARGMVGSAKAAATAAAGEAVVIDGVTSRPVPVTAIDTAMPSDYEIQDGVSEGTLEVLAAVSLSVASTVATAALAAGYGAAGTIVGLVWGAAAMMAGTLAVSGSSGCTAPSSKADAAAAAGASTRVEVGGLPPDSPHTPAIHAAASPAAAAYDRESSSSCSAGCRRSAMGGRTKSTMAAEGKAAPSPAAFGYAGPAVAAGASVAAASQGDGLGFGVLGSLAVDPDDVVKKIRSQSARMPLDEAVMQLVPLLLQQSSSASPWPLLALDAVLHAKHPALPKTLRGDFAPVNLALTVALSGAPDGPLAALLQASALLSKATSSSSSSSSSSNEQLPGLGPEVSVVEEELEAALAAAEGVDPWAVSVQLCQRLINNLWQALMGSTLSTRSTASSGSSLSIGVGTITSPEGAAAAWQAIATDLLVGTKPEVALQLLSGFVSSQDGWEAGLRALAVAAALQRSDSSAGLLLQPLLARVCRHNSHPALSFLVMLLQQQQVQLAPADTAVVLGEALQQLLAHYGTTTTADLAVPSAPASAGCNGNGGSSADGSLAGWLVLHGAGAAGEFDAWGFDALFKDLDVFGDMRPEGPQYCNSSSFAAGSESSRASCSPQPRQQRQLAAVPQVAVRQVESLVKAAMARSHAIEGADFVMQLLMLSVQQPQQHGQPPLQLPGRAVRNTKAAAVVSAMRAATLAGVEQLVFVINQEQLRKLLALTADCSIAALADAGSSSGETAAAVLPVVLPDLLAALAAACQVSSCINLAVAMCDRYQRRHMAHFAAGRRHTGVAGRADNSAAAGSAQDVMAKLVGDVVMAAAAAVAACEGSVSAVKPQGSALLTGISGALFGDGVPVEQCLVILAAVTRHVEERLALQLVAVSAAKLQSVMPQAVAVVRGSRHGQGLWGTRE